MKGFFYGQSEYYFLNSSNKIEDYVKMAKKNSFDFLTITDNNLYGSYKFYKECIKNNIKPIIGLEFSFMYGLETKESKLLIYAKNNQGFNDLLKLDSKIKIDNKSTIDLIAKNDNLIYIFVFDDSFLERSFMNSYQSLDNDFELVKELNAYVGLSYTNNFNKYDININVEKYCRMNHIKFMNIHKCLYLNKEDRIIYETLNKINEKEYDKISDFSFLTNPDFDYQIDSIVDEINVNSFNNKFELPKFKNTKGASSKEYLEALAHKGLEKRGLYFKDYINRLNYELEIINKMGYDDYFLIVWDYIRYAKTNQILVGPGRGSAASSLVAYALGITDIDPLKFNLLFERFLNPERVSMPDIDTDFPTSSRENVIEYVKDFYGKEHVYMIMGFDRFQIKSSLSYLQKVFKIDNNRALEIKDMIDKYGYDLLLEETKADKVTNDFIYVLRGMDNLARNTTIHPSGVLITSKDLNGLIPLQSCNNDLLMVGFDKNDVEELGLLKMDFLGIKNLDLLSDMINDIPDLDFNKIRNIRLDDKKTYQMLQSGDTLGIFQLDNPGITRFVKELGPKDFLDIVAIEALYRPGPMDNIPDYIKRSHGEKFEYIHKDLIPILKETYGIIVYQEQVMQIAKKFAGYSLGEADLLRRAIAKKDSGKLDELRLDFISKSVKNGYQEEIAIQIFDLIYKFANYGFNKCHSVVYSMFSYQMAYIKANYYNIFMIHMLNNVIGTKEETTNYINYAKRNKLVIYKPNINTSTNKYENGQYIFMPLNTVLSISDNIAKDIVLERTNNGLFKNINDFITRCNFLTKNQMEALIYAGALDIFQMPKKQMIKRINQNIIFINSFENMIEDNSEYDFKFLQEQELKYLGINIEYDIYKDIKDLITKNNAIPIARLEANKKATLLCGIKEIREVKTKNNNKMAILTLTDDRRIIKGILFSNTYEALKYLLNQNQLLLFYGNAKLNDKNELEFIISDIQKNIKS